MGIEENKLLGLENEGKKMKSVILCIFSIYRLSNLSKRVLKKKVEEHETGMEREDSVAGKTCSMAPQSTL